MVDEAAAGFLRAGIDRGTTIAVYMPNSAFHPITFFGGLKAGARLVMLIVFNFCQAIGYYGFANWVPTLLIGQGITVWAAPPQVSEAQRRQAETILSAFGEHVQVEDESWLRKRWVNALI